MLRFACIGSRRTPPAYLKLMEYLGEAIVENGDWVVSGNCKGADQAYAKGANKVDPTKVLLYLPWKTYETSALVKGNEVE